MDLSVSVGRTLTPGNQPVNQAAVSDAVDDIAASFTDEVTVLTTDTNLEVSLPSITNTQARHIMVSSSSYGAALTVKFGTNAMRAFPLDKPLTFNSIVFALLSADNALQVVDTAFFTNGLAMDVDVRVEVYYDPTP